MDIMMASKLWVWESRRLISMEGNCFNGTPWSALVSGLRARALRVLSRELSGQMYSTSINDFMMVMAF